MTWSVRTVPDSGSISLLARMTVTCAAAAATSAQKVAVKNRRFRSAGSRNRLGASLSPRWGLIILFRLPTAGVYPERSRRTVGCILPPLRGWHIEIHWLYIEHKRLAQSAAATKGVEVPFRSAASRR